MNVLSTNYHTHLVYCGHATGKTEDYVKKAIEDGYTELGISDHGPIPKSWMTDKEYKMLWLDEQMDFNFFHKTYIPEINAAIKKYDSKIKILKGIEIEYFEEKKEYFKQLRAKLDYMILGMHYFKYENKFQTPYVPFNYKLVVPYANAVAQALDSGLFDILAHPDIFMFYYISEEKKMYDFDSYCVEASKIIIEAAIRNNVYLEVNVGGFTKGIKKHDDKTSDYLYPRKEFWEIVKKYDKAKIIIGVDAHNPKELSGLEITTAISFANSLGLIVSDKLELRKMK